MSENILHKSLTSRSVFEHRFILAMGLLGALFPADEERRLVRLAGDGGAGGGLGDSLSGFRWEANLFP